MVLLLWNIYRKLLRNADVLMVTQAVLGEENGDSSQMKNKIER